jgi:hypothetical protein
VNEEHLPNLTAPAQDLSDLYSAGDDPKIDWDLDAADAGAAERPAS